MLSHFIILSLLSLSQTCHSMAPNTSQSAFTQLQEEYQRFWQEHKNGLYPGLGEDALKSGPDSTNFWEPLIVCAAYNSSWKLVALLTLCGADVTRTYVTDHPAGYTLLHDSSALHHAAFNGKAEIVELLLKHGANPNSIDYDLNTPLMQCFLAQAMRKNIYDDNYVTTIELLLKHGASAEIENNNGISVMHFARRIDGRSRLKKMLSQYLVLESQDSNNNDLPAAKKRKIS